MIAFSLNHIAVVVPDLVAAIVWYGDVLDFQEERRWGYPEAGVGFAYIVNNQGIKIELIERSGSAAATGRATDLFGSMLTQGSNHLGLLVEDLDQTAAKLRERGVSLIQEPVDSPPAGVRACAIRDPGGMIIEFIQNLNPAVAAHQEK
jgi:catechol 2,3-dioxygenase-like lactoylglutathione lyase family enzyme